MSLHPGALDSDHLTSREHLARFFSVGPRRLRRSWFRLVTLGEVVGFTVPVLAGMATADRAAGLVLTALVVAGAVEGAVLGLAQGTVLRAELLGFSRRDWTLATAGAASFAWFLGMLVSLTHDTWASWPVAVLTALAALAGGLLLGSMGWAQWFVLRRHVSRAWRWVPATAVAWGAGLLVFSAVTTPLWRAGQSPALVAAVGVLGGLAMAATMAWVSGWFLARIVVSGAAEAPVPPVVPEPEWTALAAATDRFAVFDPGHVTDLPAPVRRWLLHTIAPGTALLTAVEAEMHGRVLFGRTWHGFRARQRTSLAGGYLWAARSRMLGLPVSGFDRYTDEVGEMHWRLLGRFPLVNICDNEVTRSAAGRHAAEVFALLPAAALDPSVSWEPVDDVRARARLTVGGDRQQVTLHVGEDGRLRQLELRRWGAPPDCAFGPYSFGAVFDGERRFGGYRIPTLVTAGWHFGTERWAEGQFIRYELTRASFR